MLMSTGCLALLAPMVIPGSKYSNFHHIKIVVVVVVVYLHLQCTCEWPDSHSIYSCVQLSKGLFLVILLNCHDTKCT